jgi:phosphoglucomutase
LSQIGVQHFGHFSVEIVDSVNDYVDLIQSIFDFDRIRAFLARRPDFKLLFDGMHGGESKKCNYRCIHY